MANILLSISVALIVGLIMSRVVKPIKLPAVTGYLIGGILIGPYCLGKLGIDGIGFTSINQLETLKVISEIALGFIAFSIGNEFRLSQLKKTGKQVIIIGIVQALAATFVVDVGLLLLHLILGDKLPIPVIITLGAIATATAPAATLMVVQQYKAKGKLTEVLLPVVAIDDAVGLIIFAVSFGIAKVLQSGEYNLFAIIMEPILEITISLLIGGIVGTLLTFAEKHFNSRSKRMSVIVTSILITVAISMFKFEIAGLTITTSSLLLCMMLGTTFCNENEYDFSNNLMERTDRWATPLVILFFVLSGAELELSVLTNLSIVLIGATFILTRSIGKYFGAYFSAKAVKSEKCVQKYLGITLLPQAGVALGMCIKAQELGENGILIRNIVLFAIFVYELIGPYLTKRCLIKSGDIQFKDDKSK